jgi:hypothetical protein
VVAVGSPLVAEAPTARRRRFGWSWTAATAAVLVLGAGVRLALDAGGGGVGAHAAAVMTALLGLGVWTAAIVFGTPRRAFAVTLGLVILLDLAALPPRNVPEYDDREAFYRTDQVLTARVPIAPSLLTETLPVLALLVEPMFAGSQPLFGLAGDVGDTPLTWDCPFRHGMQRLALPVPRALLAGSASIDLRLRLSGSPSRESDYLLVYASSARGGFLLSLVGADIVQGATTCTLG